MKRQRLIGVQVKENCRTLDKQRLVAKEATP